MPNVGLLQSNRLQDNAQCKPYSFTEKAKVITRVQIVSYRHNYVSILGLNSFSKRFQFTFGEAVFVKNIYVYVWD